MKCVGWLTSEVSLNRVICAAPALFQNDRASSGVPPGGAISAHCTRMASLRLGMCGQWEEKGAPGWCRERPKALGSPALLVPGPRTRWTSRGAGVQGPQGTNPVACPCSCLPRWVRNSGTKAHSFLGMRPLWAAGSPREAESSRLLLLALESEQGGDGERAVNEREPGD